MGSRVHGDGILGEIIQAMFPLPPPLLPEKVGERAQNIYRQSHPRNLNAGKHRRPGVP